jgi:hypothetical protein
MTTMQVSIEEKNRQSAGTTVFLEHRTSAAVGAFCVSKSCWQQPSPVLIFLTDANKLRAGRLVIQTTVEEREIVICHAGRRF